MIIKLSTFSIYSDHVIYTRSHDSLTSICIVSQLQWHSPMILVTYYEWQLSDSSTELSFRTMSLPITAKPAQCSGCDDSCTPWMVWNYMYAPLLVCTYIHTGYVHTYRDIHTGRVVISAPPPHNDINAMTYVHTMGHVYIHCDLHIHTQIVNSNELYLLNMYCNAVLMMRTDNCPGIHYL